MFMYKIDLLISNINILYLSWGIEPNFNIYKLFIFELYSIIYVGYIIYLHKKYDNDFFKINSDKTLENMILLYILLVAYMLNMYGVLLFIILLIGFIFIVVRNKKYEHLQTFMDEYIL